MKHKFYFVLCLMVLVSLSAYSQKIKEREYDEFTKSTKITTSKETLYTRYFLMNIDKRFKFYIRKDGESKYIMFAQILSSDCEKYDESSGIMLLLDNGEIVSLTTSYTGVSKRDDKQWIFETSFVLSLQDVELLKASDIKKARVTTLDSYYDTEIIEDKRGLIKKMLLMLDE